MPTMPVFRLSSLLVSLALLPLAALAQTVSVFGTGATFPAEVYAQWAQQYSQDTGVALKYVPSGSSAGVKQMFTKMDADGDGKVTAAEMDASHSRMSSGGTHATSMSSAEKIKTIDTDRDGAITAAEHEAGASSKFTQMDTDGNGSLSSAEMQAGHARMMDKKPR